MYTTYLEKSKLKEAQQGKWAKWGQNAKDYDFGCTWKGVTNGVIARRVPQDHPALNKSRKLSAARYLEARQQSSITTSQGCTTCLTWLQRSLSELGVLLIWQGQLLLTWGGEGSNWPQAAGLMWKIVCF